MLSAPDDTKGIGDTEYSWSADKIKKELDKKSNGFAPAVDNVFFEDIKVLENCASDMGIGLEIKIEPAQAGSGDPAPDNVRAISGFTGVDITRTGKQYEKTILNGYIDTSGGYKTSTAGSKSVCTYVYAGSIAIKKDTSSVFRIGLYASRPTGNMDCISFVNVDATETSYTINVLSDCYLVVFAVNSSSASDVANSDAIIGSIVIAEKEIRTYSITWPSAGTVYGGTLTINEDGSGTLVVDRVMFAFDGSEDESWYRTTGTYNYFAIDLINAIYKNYNEKDAISNIFTQQVINNTSDNIGACVVSHQTLRVRYEADNTLTTSDLKTWLAENNLSVVIPLQNANAISYTLSPQQITSLLGTNVIWNSVGAFAVSYYLDPKAYIDDTAAIAGSFEKTDSTEEAVKEFSDGADDLPMSVQVGIEPVQNLHGYNSPWPGGTGKNLFGNGNQTISSAKYASCDLVKTLPVGDYVISAVVVSDDTDATTCRVAFYDSNGEIIGTAIQLDRDIRSSATFTLTEECVQIYFYTSDNASHGAGDSATYTDIQIETGSTESAYEPYANICPITGFDAVQITRTNINSYTTENSVDGKYIAADGTISTNADFLYTDLIPVVGNKVYAKSTNPGSTARYTRVHGYNANGTWLMQIDATQVQVNATADYSFTIPQEVAYIRISIAKSLTDVVFKMGTIYPVALPTTAYGGTLTVNKDGTGKLVADRMYKTFNGTETWTRTSGGTDNEYCATILNDVNCDSAEDSISNIYEYADVKSSTTVMGFKPVNDSANLTIRVRPVNASSHTVETFTSLLNTTNLQIVFYLASPVVIGFTAQQIRSLFGDNALWADSGNILSVSYYANQSADYIPITDIATEAETQAMIDDYYGT